MKKEFNFQTLNMDAFLPPLVKDYLHHSEKLHPFFHYKPSPDSFKESMEWKGKFFRHRNLLAEQLKKQYQSVKSEKTFTLEQIEKLKSENTFTVTTGHQLNIFTGPLYFIYKLVSVIKLSKMLKDKFDDCDFIPVYWMVTEDHDLAEINHFYFRGEKIEWNKHQPGPPCGRLSTDGLSEIADTLLIKAEGNEKLKNLILLFKECYSTHKTLSSATREIAHRLLGSHGLIIIDADDRELKSVLKPVMTDEVENNSGFRLVNETIASLEKNYKAQVHPREINFFYLGNEIRERMVKTDSGYSTLQTGKQFSKKELNAEIENHPEHFSPNVITRPLYQEMILPNIAYTGGPAEISYWMEYKSFFEYHRQRMPVLLLRDSFLWIDRHTSQLVEKTKLNVEDFLKDENTVMNMLIAASAGEESNLKTESHSLEKVYDLLLQKIASVDPSLSGSVMAEKQKALKGIDHLKEKLLKALKKKEEVNLNRIRKIQQIILPDGILQERRENMLFAAERFGEHYIDNLHEQANPFHTGLKSFSEKANN